MNWPSDLSQFSVSKSRKLSEVRSQFSRALDSQTQGPLIMYYDFLLVAKQINLRFEQAKHLMSLKSYFMQNNNSLQKQKLVNLLMVKNGQSGKDKYIVKFALPHHISPLPPILQEDEEPKTSQQSRKKKQMVIDLKLQQIRKKIPSILQKAHLSFDQMKQQLSKNGILGNEDLKGIFQLVNKQEGCNEQQLESKLKEIYSERLNENLLSSLTVVEKKSGPQLLYPLQPNMLDMKIQSSITKLQQIKKLPVFRPLKLLKKQDNRSKSQTQNQQNYVTQIQKISKIIGQNKQMKRSFGFDTNANKLRRLFVEKVILPFEKRNDEYVRKKIPKNMIDLEINSQKLV